MFDFKTLTVLTEQQIATIMSSTAPWLDGMADALRMQADGFRRFNTVTTEALERRQAGCAAAQQLVGQVRAAHNAGDVLKAQQEWLSGAMQRVMADATCWPTAGAAFLRECSRQSLQAVPEATSRRQSAA